MNGRCGELATTIQANLLAQCSRLGSALPHRFFPEQEAEETYSSHTERDTDPNSYCFGRLVEGAFVWAGIEEPVGERVDCPWIWVGPGEPVAV